MLFSTPHPFTIQVLKSGLLIILSAVYIHHLSEVNINYLLCFLLARIHDRLSSSGCSCSTGRADGGGCRGSRRKRIGVIDQGLPPLSLLYHLNQAVGHKHDDDGGYREAWEGKKNLLIELVKNLNPVENKDLCLTFEKQTFGDQLGEVQTVQGQDVVQHNAPEVESIEDGSDPTGCCF